MLINFGGIEPISFIEYPKLSSTVLFLRGCNFNCKYCYNKEITTGHDCRSILDIIHVLDNMMEYVSALVISGGEPTLQPKVIKELAVYYKEKGKKIGLYTNGSNPNVIKQLLNNNLIDFVSLDIKTIWINYKSDFGGDWQCIKKTLDILNEYKKENNDFIFRLVHPVYDENIKEAVEIMIKLLGFEIEFKQLI